jgi:hypothetical protein
VPFANESEFRFVDANQSAPQSFVSEYPQPTREPGGPKTFPSGGNKAKVMESAQSGDAKQKATAGNILRHQKFPVLIKRLAFSWDDRLSDGVVVAIAGAVFQVAALGQ